MRTNLRCEKSGLYFLISTFVIKILLFPSLVLADNLSQVDQQLLIGNWEGQLERVEFINDINSVCKGNASGVFEKIIEHETAKKLRLFYTYSSCHFELQFPGKTAWQARDELQCSFDKKAQAIIKNRSVASSNNQSYDRITYLDEEKLVLTNQLEMTLANDHPEFGRYQCSGLITKWVSEFRRLEK